MQYKKQHYQKCPRCNKEGWENDYICHKHKPATKDSVKKNCETCKHGNGFGIAGCPICYNAPQAFNYHKHLIITE